MDMSVCFCFPIAHSIESRDFQWILIFYTSFAKYSQVNLGKRLCEKGNKWKSTETKFSTMAILAKIKTWKPVSCQVFLDHLMPLSIANNGITHTGLTLATNPPSWKLSFTMEFRKGRGTCRQLQRRGNVLISNEISVFKTLLKVWMDEEYNWVSR